MPPPAGGRRPRSRGILSEEEVLDAALELLDEGGPNAASGGGSPAGLGVAPNAVYTYFPDKASVIKALGERLLGGAPPGIGRCRRISLDALRAYVDRLPAKTVDPWLMKVDLG